MAMVRGGHAGVELAALTAALITMSRYATLQDRNNTRPPRSRLRLQEQDQDRNQSGVEPLPSECMLLWCGLRALKALNSMTRQFGIPGIWHVRHSCVRQSRPFPHRSHLQPGLTHQLANCLVANNCFPRTIHPQHPRKKPPLTLISSILYITTTSLLPNFRFRSRGLRASLSTRELWPSKQ